MGPDREFDLFCHARTCAARILLSVAATGLVACLASQGVHAKTACPLAREKPMMVAEFFFGRDIEGRAPVSDADWSRFVARVVAREFPGGFTVQDAQGGWTDPLSRKLVEEPTKVLIVALPTSGQSAGRIAAVIAAYRAEFHQKSVGLITHTMCGAF